MSKVRPARRFDRRGPLTLGIVSRIAGIKQFPEMFGILAPVLARHPNVRLEIFGAWGDAAVRDLRRALEPAREQVRFGGEHEDIRAVFGCMDFLLAGLPEREGMGRNVLEAQACDVPVLAVDAPPFTETVLDAATGFLFTDPRVDGGRHFDRLLAALEHPQEAWPRPSDHPEHLARFTLDTFTQAVAGLLHYVDVDLESPRPGALVPRSDDLATTRQTPAAAST
jgi:glycosyltransferase involved in cell wall biosynthesis